MEDAPKLLKIPKSECPDIWIRLPRHKWLESWSSIEDPVVLLERNLYGHPLAGLLWERQFEKILIEVRLGEGFQLGMLIRTLVKKDYSFICMWMTSSWLERNKTLIRCGTYSTKKSTWENQHLSWITKTWAALKDNAKQAKILWTITEPCSNREFPRVELKSFHTLKILVLLRGPTIWKVMRRNVWNEYCELANRTTQQLYTVSTPCIDDHHFQEEELKSVGELSQVCSQMVLKCLYLARIGRPDILWSVNKLARSITKWTKSCDKRLNPSISDIHHTCEYKQCCYVGNTVKQCRLGLFQDSDFAGDLEDSKSTSGGTLCVFGSHTFVPRSWMC